MTGRAAPLRAAFYQALGEAWAGGAGVLLPAGFFAGAATLVPITFGPETAILAAAAPAVLWIALALASLVTMERLFQADLEDGALDLWAIGETPLSQIALVKTFAHWIVSGLPLMILAPFLGLILGIEASYWPRAAVSYGLGGLAFFFWGGFGASLAAGVRRGGLLIALIALPFYVPTAIFGALTVTSTVAMPPEAYLLAASTLFALAVAPFGMGAALRLGVG
ncbi:MAG: heme exporter protein CcmB [Pseudomonadota bacterium]